MKPVAETAAMPASRPFLTVIVAMLSMIGPFTIDTYLPSFPDIEAEFGISRALLSQSLGVYLAAFAVSTLFWGPLADRFGRRRIILSSLFFYLLSSIGCALAQNAESFLLLRTLQGLAASGGFIAGRAMIRDAHDTRAAHRAMSHVMLLFAMAPALAPVLGGWLHDHFGWRSVFWFLTGYSSLMLILILCIEETLAQDQRQSVHPMAVLRVYGRTLLHGRFLGLVFSLALSFGGMFLYIAGAPTVIYDFLGLGSDDFGLQFVPMVGGIMLGSLISGRLARARPTHFSIVLGFSLMGLSVLVNLLAASLLTISPLVAIAPLVVYALGMAMAMPAITVLILDCFPHNRGTATATQGFIQMLINAGVASVAVPLLHARWLHFALGQAGFLSLAVILWLVLARHRQAELPEMY